MYCNTVGSSNIALGANTLYYNSTGNLNVAIGNNALHTATGCYNVGIGVNAGYSETGSNRLHIANNMNCTLIYGEFDNKLVKIDCNLQVCKDLQSLTNGGGLILCSPSGTKYCLTVSNVGALVITAV
jgi:hypothetical protein